MHRTAIGCVLAGLTALVPAVVVVANDPPDRPAAPAAPVAVNAKPMTVGSHVTAVTLYQGRAAVTRIAGLDLGPGVYDLRFEGLPASIDPQTIQARGSGPVQVLGVDYEHKAVDVSSMPKVAQLDVEIDKVQREIEKITEQHKINAATGELIDRISVRVGEDATKEAGTAALNLDELLKQIEFTSKRREKLMQRRLELDAAMREANKRLALLQSQRQSIGADSDSLRTAIVTAAITAPSQVRIELTYLVSEASWQPRYNIRSAADGGGVTIEYDAVLVQRTGEDWDEVKLTLSTAQPTMAANPPMLSAWYVDLAERARVAVGMPQRSPASAPNTDPFADKTGLINRIEDLGVKSLGGILLRAGQDAEITGAGPSVTYQLPRLVTVKTTADKQQTTRIATIQGEPKFVHVAVPALTNAVYIRGDLVNASEYQLLTGPASIFVGQDYVGPTTLPAVAAKGEFKVHFGIDQAVTAKRQLVKKHEARTGLFNGGLRTSYDYRIEIDNGTGKAVTVELWDRVPVSRTDRVKIDVADLSKPLATDAAYLEKQRPEGMLKWVLQVPAASTAPSPMILAYGVRVDRASDVEFTPLPE